MHKEIERIHRNTGPEITGVDEEKVKSVVASLAFRSGQVGKTVDRFETLVWRTSQY